MESKKHKANTPQFSVEIPAMTVNVEGMTCEHCKAKVENGLRSETNITNAIANPEENTVKLYGSGIDALRIEERVKELGYIYKGIAN